MNKPNGMAQPAFDAYLKAMDEANIDPETTAVGSNRIVQTLGYAAASAGTHGPDGTLNGEVYSCAVDISVKHDLNAGQINDLLTSLWDYGFAAWWRHTGSFADNQHVHAVYAGLPMKEMLRAQIHDFLACRTGLVGHADDQFIADNLADNQEQIIRTLFLAHNPA